MTYYAVYRTDFASEHVAPEYISTHTSLERAQAKADSLNENTIGLRYQIFTLTPMVSETRCKHGFNFKHYHYAILQGVGEWCEPE